MPWDLLAVISLRSLATLFALQGQAERAAALNASADAIEAGAHVDDEMQALADALKNDADVPTWLDLQLRLEKETAEFLKP
jgi:hypothetical protein